MHVRHQRKIRAVARLDEHRRASHQPKGSGQRRMGLQAKDNEKDTRYNPEPMQPQFLRPQRARLVVQKIRQRSANGSTYNVEQAKYGRPAPGARLALVSEVEEKVGAENGVDGQLGAKRAKVGRRQHQRLGRPDDIDGLLSRGCSNNFTATGVHHFLLPALQRRLVLLGVITADVGGRHASIRHRGHVDGLIVLVAVWRRLLHLAKNTRRHHNAGVDALSGEASLDLCVPSSPFSLWEGGIGAEQEHGNGRHDDDDEWHDECDAPSDVCRVTLVVNQRVEYRRHDEICDSSPSISPASGQGIRRAHAVLIEEGCRPDLTGDKGCAKDADEETYGNKSCYVGDSTGEHSGDSTSQQNSGEGIPRSKTITARPCRQTNNEPIMKSVGGHDCSMRSHRRRD